MIELEHSWRKDFPFFEGDLVYLDSAATAQKPNVVLDSLAEAFTKYNANVHRGVYSLAEDATRKFEGARAKVASFINSKPREIVFVRNATEAINLVALSWGSANVGKGDVILLTELEHHSNIVPWQMLAKRVGATLAFVPVLKTGELNIVAAKGLLEKKPKIFAFAHVSNVLGAVAPVKELVSAARENGVVTLIDAAQSVPHLPVDVLDIGCDFLVFSGHKAYGPHVGVLYGRIEVLESMEPVLGGGDMIKDVSFERSSWNDVPWRFEAGTPNIAGVIALGSAIEYLQSVGMENVRSHERELMRYAIDLLKKDDAVTLYGPMDRVSVISFNLGDMHAHDVSSVLDGGGVCVRSGHHCAQPLMGKLGIPACVRVSFGIYNTKEDVDAFMSVLQRAKKVFGL